MLLEGREQGVEGTHQGKELLQGGAPLAIVAADGTPVGIEQGQARLGGPGQQGQLGLELGAEGLVSVHHIDDAGTVEDGRQQGAIVTKARVVPVRGDEFRQQPRPRGGVPGPCLAPGQHLPGALEPGGVHQFIKHRIVQQELVAVGLAGGAAHRRDGDVVVLHQGGHQARLALIRVSHHREPWPAAQRSPPRITSTSGIARPWRSRNAFQLWHNESRRSVS